MNQTLSHYPGLSDRTAVVTGASGAIGGAVCLALANKALLLLRVDATRTLLLAERTDTTVSTASGQAHVE